MTDVETDRLFSLIDELKHEIMELRKALAIQWEFNHAEHCGHIGQPYPHDGMCHWEMPEVLTRGTSTEEVWRLLLSPGAESAGHPPLEP